MFTRAYGMPTLCGLVFPPHPTWDSSPKGKQLHVVLVY